LAPLSADKFKKTSKKENEKLKEKITARRANVTEMHSAVGNFFFAENEMKRGEVKKNELTESVNIRYVRLYFSLHFFRQLL